MLADVTTSGYAIDGPSVPNSEGATGDSQLASGFTLLRALNKSIRPFTPTSGLKDCGPNLGKTAPQLPAWSLVHISRKLNGAFA